MNTRRNSLMAELSTRRILVDGGLYSALLGALVFGSLYYNPEIWYSDYPEEIRARVAPPGPRTRRQRAIFVPFLLLAFFVPLFYSTLLLKRRNGGRISFRAALVHTYLLFTTFNLFDAVVIDYLILTRLQPDFAALPGTEGIDMTQYVSPSDHVRNFGKGMLLGILFSAPVALAVSRRGK